jgi:uncharacterized protein
MAKKTSRRKSSVDKILKRSGGLTYLEIPATDIRRSAAFYSKVLGWKSREAGPDNPRFSDATGHLIGRWITGRPATRRPGFLPYVYVDRIDRAVKHVAKNGGEIVKPIRAEADLWVAVIRDPAGNLIGLWQEAQNPPGQINV